MFDFLFQFQSTFPRGERHNAWSYGYGNANISIHVPAWGTTVCSICSHCSFSFQSTFPRGERRLQSGKIQNLCHFNPRSRVGNDGMTAWGISQCSISIHVPAWGTTLLIRQTKHLQHYFNPRSRVGNDSNYFQNILLYFRNNH